MGYFEDRALEKFRKTKILENKALLEIFTILEQSKNYCNKEFRKICANFGAYSILSEKEVLRLLKSSSLEKSELNLANLISKIGDKDRVTAIKNALPSYMFRANEFNKKFKNIDNQIKVLKNNINTGATQTLESIAKLGFKDISRVKLTEILTANWSGVNYSKRIWNNINMLALKVKDEAIIRVLTGKSIHKSISEIQTAFDVEKYKAKRLLITESAFISGQVDLENFRGLKLTHYRFMAKLDDDTSELCTGLNNKIFKVTDAVVGTNVPPMHPNCRSFLVGVYDDDELIDKDMGKIKRPTEKELRKEHKDYKSLLGNVVPNEFDKFIDLKYNKDNNYYTKLRFDFKQQNRLKKDKSLSLHNWQNATIDNRKFTQYLFGGSNEYGLIKGRVINGILGYDINNWELLKNTIMYNINKYPVERKRIDNYGSRYEQLQVIHGLKGRSATLLVAWNIYENEVRMSSAYIL